MKFLFISITSFLFSLMSYSAQTKVVTTGDQMIRDIAFTGGFNRHDTSIPNISCKVMYKNSLIQFVFSDMNTQLITNTEAFLVNESDVVMQVDSKLNSLNQSVYTLPNGVKIHFYYHPIQIGFQKDANNIVFCKSK